MIFTSHTGNAVMCDTSHDAGMKLHDLSHDISHDAGMHVTCPTGKSALTYMLSQRDNTSALFPFIESRGTRAHSVHTMYNTWSLHRL